MEAIKTLAAMMESLLLSNRNLKISVKGLSGFQFDLKECKSMQIRNNSCTYMGLE
jgi:hypothetical protein